MRTAPPRNPWANALRNVAGLQCVSESAPCRRERRTRAPWKRARCDRAGASGGLGGGGLSLVPAPAGRRDIGHATHPGGGPGPAVKTRAARKHWQQ